MKNLFVLMCTLIASTAFAEQPDYLAGALTLSENRESTSIMQYTQTNDQNKQESIDCYLEHGRKTYQRYVNAAFIVNDFSSVDSSTLTRGDMQSILDTLSGGGMPLPSYVNGLDEFKEYFKEMSAGGTEYHGTDAETYKYEISLISYETGREFSMFCNSDIELDYDALIETLNSHGSLKFKTDIL